MGCKVQIHEKSDNRGTLVYHSVDGWYLYTLSEHYCTYNCIKNSPGANDKRLSDTVQFQVKDITNPTVTHADKLIITIVTCINTVCNLCNGKKENNIHNLNQLLEVIKQIVERNKDKATEEPTKPPSTNLDESVKRNKNKTTGAASEPSITNPDKSSPDTSPFKRVTRSMQ